jgi:hypothetical protein
MLVIITGCGNDADVIIGTQLPAGDGTIYGEIMPDSMHTTVCLLEAFDTIATVTAQPYRGRFVFRDLPFGIYTLIAFNADWEGSDMVYLEEAGPERVYIQLNHRYLDFDLRTISARDMRDDYTVIVDIDGNGSAVIDTIRLTPSLRHEIVRSWVDAGVLGVKIDVHELFAVDTLTARVAYRHESLGRDTLALRYPVDSLGLSEGLLREIISKVSSPGDYVTPRLLDEPDLRLYPEESVIVSFGRPMNRSATERSITIEPPVGANYFWHGDKVTIVPALPLDPDTTYRLSIGTEAMTLDSVHPPGPCAFTLIIREQNFFTSYFPLDSAEQVAPALPFSFTSAYSLEPSMLREAFSITPPVDSLVFSSPDEGVVEVSHATLLPDTTYTITIDTTLSSRKGTTSGEILVIRFRTRPAS